MKWRCSCLDHPSLSPPASSTVLTCGSYEVTHRTHFFNLSNSAPSSSAVHTGRKVKPPVFFCHTCIHRAGLWPPTAPSPSPISPRKWKSVSSLNIVAFLTMKLCPGSIYKRICNKTPNLSPPYSKCLCLIPSVNLALEVMWTLSVCFVQQSDNRPLWSRLKAARETRYLILCGMLGRNLPILGLHFHHFSVHVAPVQKHSLNYHGVAWLG